MATIRLTAKREGALLSTEINREITFEQLELVKRLISLTDDADVYSLEALALSLELTAELRQPREGIEQYQAEDR